MVGCAIIGISFSFPGMRDSRDPMPLSRDKAGRLFADDIGEEYGFDASFFNISPREATLIDPQQRMLIECAWKALENAGYSSLTFKGRIGVFAGSAENTYLPNIIIPNGLGSQPEDALLVRLGNTSDHLATRISYLLGLTGPGITVQADVCTAATAIHLACQSLAFFECDIALAGAVSLQFEQDISSDLKLENNADKTDFSVQNKPASDSYAQGVGMLVLRRMDEAFAEHDYIHARILGSAMGFSPVNNNHNLSVKDKANIIKQAYSLSEISPKTIEFLESCSSEDLSVKQVDIEALADAFRAETEAKPFCAVGSSLIGFDQVSPVSGLVGLFKTIAAFKSETIPPVAREESRAMSIDLNDTSFFTSAEPMKWPVRQEPRRAALHSSSRIGYCAHIVLEESPPSRVSAHDRPYLLFPLSAKTQEVLTRYAGNLADTLQNLDNGVAADAAYTLQVGRSPFPCRLAVVARSGKEAALQLRNPETAKNQLFEFGKSCPVVFLFSGQGMHYPGMATSLYYGEKTFREIIDHCTGYLREHADLDILSAIVDDKKAGNGKFENIDTAKVVQPAIFVVQYAMAKLWAEWGVIPDALLGHSLGELAAACFSGVMELEDALKVVAARGAIINELPSGSMTAVLADKTTLLNILPKSVDLSAENGPGLFTVSGSDKHVSKFIKMARKKGIGCVRLKTSHAFHSRFMDPAFSDFLEVFRSLKLQQPQIPLVSSVTGDWLRMEEAVSAQYWAEHIRRPVLFGPALTEAVGELKGIYLEMGPGNALTQIGQRYFENNGFPVFFSAMGRPRDKGAEHENVFKSLAKIWKRGGSVDWQGVHRNNCLGRYPLPSYPFDRRRCWPKSVKTDNKQNDRLPLNDWFSVLEWEKVTPDVDSKVKRQPRQVLLLADEHGLGDAIGLALWEKGSVVTFARQGRTFSYVQSGMFTIRPLIEQDYHDLLEYFKKRESLPDLVINCWSYSPVKPAESENEKINFLSLLWLVKALAAFPAPESRRLISLTNNLFCITGRENINAEKSTLMGINNVVNQELPDFQSRIFDLSEPFPRRMDQVDIQLLVKEILGQGINSLAAFRDRERWLPKIQSFVAPPAAAGRKILRDKGVYLITGGLGGIGLTLAKGLAREVQARLVLLGRSHVDEELPLAEMTGNSVKKIEAIKELRSLGAEVAVFSADVSDQTRMKIVIEQVKERWGQIHGIIHAAGIPAGSVMARLSEDAVQAVLRPKIDGALILDDLTRNDNLDFMVLCSSLSSLLGGAAQAHYSAANAFLDMFALARSRKSQGISLSIAWDTWHGVGMAAEVEVPVNMEEHRNRQLQYGIRPDEGWDVFLRLLAGDQNRVFVSTRPLEIRRKAILALDNVGTSFNLIPREDRERKGIQANGNLLEKVLDIWKEVLDISHISPEDDFFELGGNSLIGVSLLHQMQKQLSLSIPLSVLENISTPRQMAESLTDQTENNNSKQKNLPAFAFYLSEQEIKEMMAVLASSPIPLIRKDSFIKGFNTDGKRRPIFWCFNSPTMEPERLVKELDSEQPLYVLFSGVGVFDWQDSNAEKIGEKLAKVYLNDIIALQPQGPYWLGGNCAGARVARALATLLKERGNRIERLCFMEYFQEDLFHYREPLLLLYGEKSHFQVQRKFNWLENGWEDKFDVVPDVSWIPGEHGQFFQQENIKALAAKIRQFFKDNI